MIAIQNIYHMLSYAFQVLNEQGYKNLSTEEFDNTAELCAAILAKWVTVQIKRGIGREYIPVSESRSTLRGKLEITDSIRDKTVLKKQMVCSYDEFSVNTYMNQIIKSTVLLLLHSDITKERKKELRKLMVYFADVEVLDLHRINWNMQYNRNNQTYRMLVSVCYLIVNGLLQTQADGSVRLMDFLDEQRMCRLYERFILEYYHKEFPLLHVSASQIPWAVDDDSRNMLPIMKSDVMLTYKNAVLIIDAKYYSHTTQQRYGIHTLHSNNLYQIFTYVKNKEMEFEGKPHTVSGMLLYARTDEDIQPAQSFRMSGNRIDVKTLDLNCDFSEIKEQLNGIVEEFFEEVYSA